jgi:hypothetical protein
LRAVYDYDLDLPSGSGPSGTSHDGTSDSFALLARLIIEPGNHIACPISKRGQIIFFAREESLCSRILKRQKTGGL